MGKLAILTVLAAGLAGCASTEPYGNFVAENAPASLHETLAGDTVKTLIALYPPASTRFDLGQPTPDVYGVALVESLRARGYALKEFRPEPETKPGNQESVATGLSLRYVLDAPASTDLYRVTVMVGPTSLSRAYTARNNTVAPAGAWVRKE